MKPLIFSVDVVMERIPLASRWADWSWQPSAVVPLGEGALAPGDPVCAADGAVWRFPRMPIELHPSEAEGYYLNLTSDTPVVFVMWRHDDGGGACAACPQIVTLSYNQAGRLMDGGERVDTVAMPEPIRTWLAAFVAEHYKPEPKRKVRRNDPFADDPLREKRGR
ncbi:MAG: DUF3305 domain-containing protein [Burkholderiales bacterium]